MISLNDVLLAMSNIPVDDPIAEIWGRGLQGGYKIIEYTGSLPITISANGDALIDYRIYGASGGVGEPTENLIDASLSKQTIEIKPSTSYTVSRYENSYNAPGLKFGIYDENDNLIWSDYLGVWRGEDLRVFGNAKYFKITIPNNCLNAVSLVEGQRPAGLGTGDPYPANYIPYGYKLPMTVYKQEFKIVSDMLDQSNWVVAELQYMMYFDISDFISKEECDAKIYENFTEGYVPEKLVVSLTDRMDPTVPNARRILNNNGVILNKKFNFSSWNKIYLCIGYGDKFLNEATKQSKIDELFGNWKILIAPTSQTREAPVYIGENQLDSVEGVADYVDKARGKIVRMIGEYTFTGDESFNKYGNSDVFYTSTTIDPVGITTVNTITMRCDHPAFTAIENKDTRYWLNPEADNICCFLPGGRSQVFLRSTSNFTTATECKAYLKAQYDNGTPVKISYWLKTPVEEDPPVPSPSIPTIDGTTVIDYDGDPKPSQMYIKYKGKG